MTNEKDSVVILVYNVEINTTIEKVRVFITVNNAKRYISKAIDSALALTETGEIILVNDGYPDGAWEICCDYAARYPIIRLFSHPDGENKGAAASRNIGIKNA